MAAFVVGHGNRQLGQRLGRRMTADEARELQKKPKPQGAGTWVWVPPTVQRLVFYADFDQSLLAVISLAVLNAGNVGPREEYLAGEEVPNYSLRPIEDTLMAEQLASVSSRLPGKLYMIGTNLSIPQGADRIWLCTTPWVCNALPADQGHDTNCEGLFRQLSGVTDVHLLACRIVRGQRTYLQTREMDVIEETVDDGTATEAQLRRVSLYGDTPTAYLESIKEERKRIFRWAATDPQAALSYVHSLPQASVVSLRQHSLFRYWLEQMHHPFTPDSEPQQVLGLAKSIASLRDDDVATAVAYWQALPAPTRRVLENPQLHLRNADDPQLMEARNIIRDFLRETGEWTEDTPVASAPPYDFFTAWADANWRNALWRHLTDHPPADINVDALLALLDRLRNLPAVPPVIALEDIDYFLTHQWSNPPQPIATAAADLHALLAHIGTPSPDLLNPAPDGSQTDTGRRGSKRPREYETELPDPKRRRIDTDPAFLDDETAHRGADDEIMADADELPAIHQDDPEHPAQTIRNDYLLLTDLPVDVQASFVSLLHQLTSSTTDLLDRLYREYLHHLGY